MRLSMWTAVAAVVVSGSSYAAENSPLRIDEVVVTATRFKEHYGDKPVNITVITAEDIEHSAAKTVPELLSQQAGVAVRDLFGNNAAGATVDLRGFGAAATQNTLILVDGRRAGDIDLSGVQWPALPLTAIERIEIVRGGGAVLYGDGATAGVINIITKSPTALASGVTVQGRAGSYASGGSSVSAHHSGDRAGFGINADNYESDGYRANNRQRQSSALADLRFLTEEGELAFKIGADRNGLRLPGARRVQPSAGINQLETDRRGAQTPLDYAQRNGDRATLDWRRQTGFGELNLSAGWRDKEQISYFDFGGFPDYRVANLDVWSFTPRVKVAHGLPGSSGTLIMGADWYRWRYRLRRANSSANIGQPVNTVTATQYNTAIYLHETSRIGERLTVSAGVRRERFGIDAADAFDATAPGGVFGSGAPAGSQREAEYAYELGARYRFSPLLALSGRSGRSYRFANIDETYETSASFANQFQFLRPQTARSHEMGMEMQTARSWLRAALFTIDVNDEIHLDPFTSGIGNTNLPPSRRRGLELEGKWQAPAGLTLAAAYTYTDARFRQGVFAGGGFFLADQVIAGKTVPLVPRHKLAFNASWAVGARTRLNARASYVGEQYMDNDESNTMGVKIPSYALLDVKFVHRSGGWSLSAAVNNLFDRKYYNYAVRSAAVPDRYNAYPLPQRNVMVTAEYAFR
ncbi:MAG: TonB-dependent receptor [Burkholderiales bacterium]